MSFTDIEKLIGSPMQIPVDLNSGDEYYQRFKHDDNADDEMSEIDENDNDDNDMSDNSIEYCDPDGGYEQQASQEYYYQPTQFQLEEQYKQKQKEIQKKQQQEEQYKKFIESLKFMSINEQQIMLYQENSNHCVIQMEF